MIKRLLSIVVAIAFCLQAEGQSTFTPEWNIGVGFGPTISSLSIIPTKQSLSLKSNSIPQFHGGVSVRYISERYLGFIAELNFSQQGWEQNFENLTNVSVANEFVYKQKLNYIELPLLTHIYFGNKRFRGFVNLGPKVGYMLSETTEMSETLKSWLVGDFSSEPTPDPTKYTLAHYNKKADKKFDYGLMGGLGVELRTGIGNFSLEGRYYMGLADIYNNRKSDDFYRSAHRIISARLTYYIKAF